MFEVSVLGSNSAKPAYGRHPSAHLLNVNNNYYLIDCGEATQFQLAKYRIKTSKIDHIFITHLHGDHFLGLMPLLDSYNLDGRTKPIHLYGPPDLAKLIDIHTKVTCSHRNYELIFHPIEANQSSIIFDSNDLVVKTLLLDHRVPCTGFLFSEKPKARKMLGEKIKEHAIPFSVIPSIKQGADFTTVEGQVIPNDVLTTDAPPSYAYAYCSDTAYLPDLIPQIKGVDLLYHEATYLKDYAEQAVERGHATAQQAANLAKQAGVKHLVLGHFSSRYKAINEFLEEAQPVFSNTYLAKEGRVFSLKNEELIITEREAVSYE